MTLPGEIIKLVIDSRSSLGADQAPTQPVDGLNALTSESSPQAPARPTKLPICEVPEMTIQQAEHILSFGLPIAVHIVLVHEDCKMSDPCECPGARQVEVWTIRKQKEIKEEDMRPILALFLKQAIKSQLHFSPVNSWVKHNSDQFPRGIRCSYRLSTSSHFHVDSNDASVHIEKHKFPYCKLENGEFMTIEVKWMRKNGFPEMQNTCPSVRVEESVEWILGSPSSSPVGCSTPLEFPSLCPSPLSTSPGNSTIFVYTTNQHFPTNTTGPTPTSSPNTISPHTSTPTRPTSFDHATGISGQTSVTSHQNTSPKNEADEVKYEKKTEVKSTATEVEMLSDFLASSSIASPSPPLKRNNDAENSDETSQKFQSNLSAKNGSRQQKVFRKSPPSGSPGSSGHSSNSGCARRSRARRNTTGSALSEKDDEDDVEESSTSKPAPRMRPSTSFCGSIAFNPKTRLPMNSSPAPLKRSPRNLATKLRERLAVDDSSSSDSECITGNSKIYGNKISHTGLVCNFEESALNGRIEPVATIDGFQLQIAVHGAFSVPHVMLPVTTFFFDVSEDDTPSLYLGHCSLSSFPRKAFHIPKKCTVQATLFNPQGSVVKIFIVKIDVSDMPPKSKTFVRQRTYCMPEKLGIKLAERSWLKYLIHLRLATDRSGKLYMHTDIRMLFSNKTDVDVLNLAAATKNSTFGKTTGRSPPTIKEEYKLLSSTEMPQRPKYSPTK